jgi:hypothetical protein
LGHLISIIKIFLQAAILSDDEKNLLTLIVSSSTSPFKKQSALPGQAHGNQSYGHENTSSNQSASGDGTHSDKETSSVNTARFGNSFHSATPPAIGQTAQGEQEGRSDHGGTAEPADNHSQTSFSGNQRTAGAVPARRGANQHDGPTGGSKVVSSTNAQVDDFPKLLEQMRQRGIAKTILSSVDFGSFVRKLLQIVQASTCVFSKLNLNESAAPAQQPTALGKPDQSSGGEDSVPQLVQNSLDLLLPCLLWDPQILMGQLYQYEHFEKLLIQGLIHNKSEKIRKSIEQTFKTLCYHIQGQQAKDAKNMESVHHQSQAAEAEGTCLQDDDGSKPSGKAMHDASLKEHDLNPKLFLLKILIRNLPKGTVRGKVKNMESQYFDEYFNLLSSLIKICQDKFQSDDEQ